MTKACAHGYELVREDVLMDGGLCWIYVCSRPAFREVTKVWRVSWKTALSDFRTYGLGVHQEDRWIYVILDSPHD